MATNKVVLISPFLQLSDNWLSALHKTGSRKVEIKVIYGKEKLHPATRETLANIPGLSLWFMRHLHAKCYYNEQQMVITSMNLYAYSAENNHEMGILLDKMNDAQAFADAIQVSEGFIEAAQRELFLLPPRLHVIKSHAPEYNGKCTRCAGQIEYDPSHPLCRNCIQEIRPSSLQDWMANFCHCCGAFVKISILNPVCTICTQQQLGTDRLPTAV